MLESRLIRTEELLIRALALLDDAQVTSVVYGSSVMNQGQAGGITFERPDPRYWSDYPLDTPEDIRRWWHAKSGSVVRQGIRRPSRSHSGGILPRAAFGSVDDVDKRRRDSIERMPEPEMPSGGYSGSTPGSGPSTLTRRLTEERPPKRLQTHRGGRSGERELDQDVFW
ncbi:hypothetical protein KVT40_008960 [Elsinoe batatas]|uniref:Uncharacterized protein n=1 Tax=Elsinoe batatas TaxID=2601811 RepID=A0A8K0PFW9_9PEZI|nr:hypothetical protein KVT40_008960 [Elsinoe batatas]